MKKKFFSDIKKLFSVRMRYPEKQMAGTDICMKMKEKYYQDLEASHEQYDIFLHDIKHMLRTIFALSKEGDCEKIGCIVKEMGASIGNIEEKIICSHKILNALLSERIGYADDIGITLKANIKEPLYLQGIDDLDLISIMGNLLDNAIEAEKAADKPKGVLCCIAMAKEGRHVVIRIENSYNRQPEDKKKAKKYIEEIGHKHGIGLESVQKILRKYGGIMDDSDEKDRYRVKVIIPVQDGRMGPENQPLHNSVK